MGRLRGYEGERGAVEAGLREVAEEKVRGGQGVLVVGCMHA